MQSTTKSINDWTPRSDKISSGGETQLFQVDAKVELVQAAEPKS